MLFNFVQEMLIKLFKRKAPLEYYNLISTRSIAIGDIDKVQSARKLRSIQSMISISCRSNPCFR